MEAPAVEEDAGTQSDSTVLSVVPGSGGVGEAANVDEPKRFDTSKSLRSISSVEGGGG